MTKHFSIYLDLLRLSAAIAVFLSHITIMGNPSLWMLKVFPAHEAVILFFVLSGYVIAFVVYDKKETSKDYIVNRIARIYSVVIPAILITLVSFSVCLYLELPLLSWFDDKLSSPIYTVTTVFFMLHQSWQQVFFYTNEAIWSIAFEMFYYLLFACFVYLGGAKRVIAIILACLLMGPNILFYAPLWYIGVIAWRVNKKFLMSLKVASLGSFLTLIIIIGFILGIGESHALSLTKAIFPTFLLSSFNPQTQNIIYDYALAIIIGLHFISVHSLSRYKAFFPAVLAKSIKKAAGCTFSLYLYHLPLLYLITVLISAREYMFLHGFVVLIILPMIIYGLSLITENKKYVLKQGILKLMSQVKHNA